VITQRLNAVIDVTLTSVRSAFHLYFEPLVRLARRAQQIATELNRAKQSERELMTATELEFEKMALELETLLAKFERDLSGFDRDSSRADMRELVKQTAAKREQAKLEVEVTNLEWERRLARFNIVASLEMLTIGLCFAVFAVNSMTLSSYLFYVSLFSILPAAVLLSFGIGGYLTARTRLRSVTSKIRALHTRILSQSSPLESTR